MININVNFSIDSTKKSIGPVTTSYRSPLASARRQLFYCAGLPNLYHFSDDQFLLTIFLMYFAGWMCTEENDGAYDMKMLFPRPVECFGELLSLGWIYPPDPETSLNQATIPQLSALRTELGLQPKKGKKTQLVLSVLQDAPKDALLHYAQTHWYAFLTPEGYSVLRSFYNERVETEVSAADALFQHRDQEALGIVEEYRRRRPIFTQPSSYFDVPYPLNTPIECLVAVSKQYFSGSSITREYLDFFTEHPDAVMHDGMAAFLGITQEHS